MSITKSITKPRNFDKAKLLADDAAHHWHPFTDHQQLHHDKTTRVITHADGVYLWDIDGNRILDGMAGLWCTQVGYGRQKLAEVAYQQIMEIPFYNTFFKTTTPPVPSLAKKIADLLPSSLNHVFFGQSGSDANDTILRMVRQFWILEGKAYKRHIISRENAYHGSTVAGASLGGMSAIHKQVGQEVKDIHHIQQPYWYKEGAGQSPEEFGLTAAAALEKKILELGPQNVAAFIGEPIQGAGGVIIPPASYWPEISRICQRYDVLLIADEVICGFGRTGEWFGHNYFGFTPDMVTMAKGLSSGYQAISAVGIGDRVHKTLYEKGGEFFHGYTYSGHPVACAVALANLEIIEEEKLVTKVKEETGPYLAKALQNFQDHPLVGEVRSAGLIGAIELVKNKQTHERFENLGRVGTMCRDHFFKRNAIMRACGDTMVLSPPLIITADQIDELLGVAKQALDATAKDLGIS